MRSREKLRLRFVWLTAGIILAAVIGAMAASGSYNPDQLLNHGSVYEFTRKSLELHSKTCSYDEETCVFTVLTDSAKKRFSKVPIEQWSYIEFELDWLNMQSAVWNILYLDKNKNVIAQQPVNVVQGSNTVQITCEEKFRYIYLQILNQPGLQFSLSKVQMRTGDIVTFSEWIKQFIGYFMIYLLLSAAWCFWKCKNRYIPVELLQYVFIRIGDYNGRKFAARFNEKQKDQLRTALFSILFLGMIAANAFGIYSTNAGYRYCLIFAAAILMCIAFLLWERPLKYVKWKNDVAFFWFFYWGVVCIMDFVTDKHFRYTGYACLIGMLQLVFIWNQCRKPARLWKNMINGLVITFILIMLFCMIFRGRRAGVLYNGVFTNREDMAIYSVTMLGVFLLILGKLIFQYDGKWNKRKMLQFFAAVSAVSLCVHNLYLTRIPMSIFLGGALFLCFLLLLIVRRKQLKTGIIKTVMWLTAAALCSAIVVFPVHWCMNELPQILGTDVKFQQEVLESDVPADVMKEEKILTWKAYIREINLLGRTALLRVAQRQTMAESGWLELMYRYGIFVLLPFIGLWGSALEKCIRKQYWGFCLLFAGYHILFFTQNIEKPFLQPLWIFSYLGIGCLIQTDCKETQEVL